MILKLISIPELDFHSSCKDGITKISKLNTFDKYMTIFWLLGPFIYLLERSPADIWLSLIGIIFLARCFIKKDWKWIFQRWFKLSLFLWIIGIFSGLSSPDPLFSLGQGLVWIRFPLYAAAAQVWLAKDRDIRIIMLLSILIGMILICIILICETVFEPKTRLTWPYGDVIPGSYVAKFSLPLFAVLVAIAVSKLNKQGLTSGLIALISIIVTGLTGERGNFLIRACTGMLAGLIWKPKFWIYCSLILLQIIIIISIAISRPDLSDRFSKQFFNKIPIFNTSDNNPHWGAWRSGIQQGILTPIKGIGPSGTRKTCQNLNTDQLQWLPGKNYCGNHPHNFYIQLFAEVGIIGLIIGAFMFFSIILTCYKARKENFDCPMSATAYITPLALFFPIQQFGSFYGQWGNLFIWFAIGFAISQYQNWEIKQE